MGWKNKKPDPTPDEIRERCAEVRAGWSESMREKRRFKTDDYLPWLPPLINLAEFPLLRFAETYDES